jgi:hypothetical protein
MSYTESESMALKRLKVALKRSDWQLFEYGLTRTNELISSGAQMTEIQEWYRMYENSKAENIPQDLQKILGQIVESIAPEQSTQQRTPTSFTQPASETQKLTPAKSITSTKIKTADTPFTVFYNSEISQDHFKTLTNLRLFLDNATINPDTQISTTLLSELSVLIHSLDKPNKELDGIEEFFKAYNNSGIIITTGIDSELINILEKNDIDYSIDNVKKPSSNKYWKIYPLGGLTSIFYCPSCKTRSYYHNEYNTVLATCNKCGKAAYPDIYITNIDNPTGNPKTWYMSYEALANAGNWLLLSPPNVNQKTLSNHLLTESCGKALANNVYIVSINSEIGGGWRNKIEETVSNCNVAPVCFNVEILFNNYIKLPDSKTPANK